jgi:hypothetical protein
MLGLFLALFGTFMLKAPKKAQKKKNAFYKHVLGLKFATIKGSALSSW